MGPVSFAFLFAAHRSATSLVEIFAGAAHSRRTARFSRHLLLLPQSLLPRIFLGSASMRRRRAFKPQIQRRDRVSLYPAKYSPLLFLSRARVPRFSLVRRGARLQFRRPFRHWRRHPG